MFSDELEHISWEETTARIHAKTDADVRRALDVYKRQILALPA